MIQRIQSLYLLVVVILLIVCMYNPVGDIISIHKEVSEFGNLCITLPDGTKDYASCSLFILLLLSSVIALGTIFLFNKRMLQIRLTVFNSIILIGYYGVLVFFATTVLAEDTTFNASWSVCLPLIAIILNWLAIRAIGKDEVLVKAYDRLR